MCISVTASIHHSVRNVIDQVAQRRGLKTRYDLVLTFTTPQQTFLLDDDEYIWDVAQYI